MKERSRQKGKPNVKAAEKWNSYKCYTPTNAARARENKLNWETEKYENLTANGKTDSNKLFYDERRKANRRISALFFSNRSWSHRYNLQIDPSSVQFHPTVNAETSQVTINIRSPCSKSIWILDRWLLRSNFLRAVWPVSLMLLHFASIRNWSSALHTKFDDKIENATTSSRHYSIAQAPFGQHQRISIWPKSLLDRKRKIGERIIRVFTGCLSFFAQHKLSFMFIVCSPIIAPKSQVYWQCILIFGSFSHLSSLRLPSHSSSTRLPRISVLVLFPLFLLFIIWRCSEYTATLDSW